MIPSGNNYVTYSYRSFRDKDKEVNDVDREDTIDFDELDSTVDSIRINERRSIRNYLNLAVSDLTNGDPFKGCVFFKDFFLTFKENVTPKIFRFIVSDEEDTKKDQRTLTVICYKKNDDRTLEKEGSWRVKLDHVYQVYQDLLGYKNYINEENYRTVNLYVLPIYVLHKVRLATTLELHYSYARISDIRFIWDLEDMKFNFDTLCYGLYLFLSINYMLVSNVKSVYKDDDKFKDDTIHPEIRTYFKQATEDKQVVVKRNHFNMYLNGRRNNITQKVITRAECDYKYQVSGHWHKYWVGSRDDRHLITKWVAPYYKNKDKEFSIAKKIEA